MNKDILFSVIIPCFNCAEYLSRSLSSVINQNYKNIEIILVNDGSTDESGRIAEDILKESEIKYKIVNQENKGVSFARNKGLDYANGEYIYFFDADDYIHKNLFNEIINKLEEYKYDILIFGYIKLEDEKIKYKYSDKYRYVNDSISGIEAIELFLKEDIYLQICSCVIKREVIKDNSIRFRNGCAYGEDGEFLVKSLYYSKSIIMIQEELFYYYNRSNSAMNTFSVKRFTGVDAFMGVKEFLEDKMVENTVMKLIDKRVSEEIVAVCNSYAKNYSYITMKYYKLIKSMINNNKEVLKSFELADEGNVKLKKTVNILLLDPVIYLLLVKMKSTVNRCLVKLSIR